MELDQNDNYFSSDFVNQDYEQNFNQGTVKGYTDFQDNIPTNTIMRKPMSTSYNYMNNLNNIPPNKTQTKNKDNQKNEENNNPFLNKEIIPERTMSNFYGSQFLTDAILKVDEQEIPFHKIVLCVRLLPQQVQM